ncbi:MAG: hydantoinase/oxoprolinase family protein [Betaproteobacteria bacterium]|nr:hydantoinase/oxoprolinase family protein [Betaproteobacteria bacterium]
MSKRIGIDIGGTFTDVVYFRDGTIERGKADTTHYDLKVGVMNALAAAAGKSGIKLDEAVRSADSIVYSTTVGTNALIERKGTKLGLITTKGFEDTVPVGRSKNFADGLEPAKKYDRGRAQRPLPIVQRNHIVGIQERIDNLGRVFMPIREAEIRRKLQYLVDQGVRGFVVVLLNSFVNPEHEQLIGRIINEQFPETCLGHMPVYLSHQISPKLGEYRRSMTVLLDAYLREVTEDHLVRLSDELRDGGYHRPVFVAKNTGGLSSLSRSQALHLFGSSPAATVVGADHVGKMIGTRSILVSDMGGTSFDVGVVVEGRERVYEYDPIIDRFRVQIPYVAHWSVGAGGGSIAKLFDGHLTVGPESAGSNPGPACYNRGGDKPTVTDADVVLGYLNPDNFLGGAKKLVAARATEAIGKHIAEPLGITVLDAAWRIKQLIDGYMGQEMYRICTLISGQDPRDFVLFALGGAGPVHAAGYAEGTDVGRIATFPFSSVFGAFSTLGMDIVQSYEKSVNLNLYSYRTQSYSTDNIAVFNAEVEKLVELSRRDMEEEGFDLSRISTQLELQMCYGQQRQTLPIVVPELKLASAENIKTVCDLFNDTYAEKYGKGACYPEAGIEVVELRLNAIGPVDKYVMEKQPRAGKDGAKAGSRAAYWGPERGLVATPIYLRDSLASGVEIDGPAIVEADDTVIIAPPGWRYHTDDYGIGWLERVR